MLNKIHLIGNLGNDPILKKLDSGKSVVEFRLATSERWKNKDGERQERTDWHNIVIWDRTAEIAAEYLKSGSKVYLEGRVNYRTWEDDQGVKKYKTDIVCDRMQMLDSKSTAKVTTEVGTTADTGETVAVASSGEGDGDLPF